MVQPFIVTPDYGDDQISFAESSEGSIVQVREDTPPPVARRLFGNGGSGSGPAAPPAAAQSRQRRGSGGLRSLCCGLFPRRHCLDTHTADVSTTAPSTPLFSWMTQRVPVAHTTIPEEDEDEDEQLSGQENQPPTIVETLVQINQHNDDHTDEQNGTSHQAEEDLEQEMLEEHDVRRRSIRHSWVTVSRWLE
jgi:hypothetical protein